MKIIFIGNPIKEKLLGKDKKYRYTSFADNFMQIKFINEIYSKYKDDFELITINYGNNKTYKKGRFNNIKTTYMKYHPKNSWTYYLSFMFNIFKETIKYCRKYKKEDLVIITNGPYMYYSFPIIIAKLFYKFKYICYLICSVELPEYKGIYGLVAKLSKYFIKSADATITYVEKSSIDYTDKPYLNINYQIDQKKLKISEELIILKKDKSKIINISYSGALTNIYGISSLLKVIDKLPDNYVLTICGDGECKEIVEKFQKEKPKKLHYLGLLPPEEVIKLQKKSNILICLKVDEYYGKYSNSSKITEYLLSENPIIVNNYEGINTDIKPYLNIADSTDIDYLADYIIDLSKKLNSKEIKDKCKKGREYVIKNCIEGAQSKKICDFIEKIGKSK